MPVLLRTKVREEGRGEERKQKEIIISISTFNFLFLGTSNMQHCKMQTNVGAGTAMVLREWLQTPNVTRRAREMRMRSVGQDGETLFTLHSLNLQYVFLSCHSPFLPLHLLFASSLANQN